MNYRMLICIATALDASQQAAVAATSLYQQVATAFDVKDYSKATDLLSAVPASKRSTGMIIDLALAECYAGNPSGAATDLSSVGTAMLSNVLESTKSEVINCLYKLHSGNNAFEGTTSSRTVTKTTVTIDGGDYADSLPRTTKDVDLMRAQLEAAPVKQRADGVGLQSESARPPASPQPVPTDTGVATSNARQLLAEFEDPAIE